MSDDGPRKRSRPLTGPAAFAPKPTGSWEIYTVQRQLPGIDDEAHNYLALVRPDGTIDAEMQGVYTRDFSLGTESGNYLNVQIWRPNTYMNNQYVRKPIIGTPRSVYSGGEAEVRAKWSNAFDTVAKAIDKNHTLYAGYPLNPFSRIYNSNSVWGTALRSMGVKHPQDFNGPLEAPGWATDLRMAPTNNDDIGTPDDARWRANPPIGNIYQSDASPASRAGSSLSAADAVADAGRAPRPARTKNWRGRPEDFSSVDLLRALI